MKKENWSTEKLRAYTLDKAETLANGCVWRLEHREKRSAVEIQSLVDAAIRYFVGDDEYCTWEDAIFWWDMNFLPSTINWVKTHAAIENDLGHSYSPRLEIAEFALVTSFILNARAAAHLKTKSHREHLLAALLLADAVEASEYWTVLRGITRCRNPNERWVNETNRIQDMERKEWLQTINRKVGKNLAEIRHSASGGTREKRSRILEIWATGKYPNRDKCAEMECDALRMSFSTARKALRNAPVPKKMQPLRRTG